jgi:putative MATE family efflux protein
MDAVTHTAERDWTKGSIVGNLWSLAWPMIISYSLWAVGRTIDMIWVGKLGATSIAGVGVAVIVIMLGMTAQFGIVVGARAMIARFVGAGDAEAANYTSGQAFVISTSYAIVMAAIGIFLAKTILSLFGLEAEVVAEGAAYLRIAFVAWMPMSFWTTAFGIMQASGDAVVPLRIAILFRSAHAALCPFLVLGWWIFPHLGVSGAAISNVAADTLGMALGLWVLFNGRTRIRLTLRYFRPDLNLIWRIVKISIPAIVAGVQRTFGGLVLMRFMVAFGTLAVAAHSLGQNVETILLMPGAGLGMAGAVLVGQNLGASQPKRAERSGWLAVGLMEAFIAIFAVAILLKPESIIGIFNTEPALVELTSIFLMIAIVGYLALAFSNILQNCIAGAGDTIPPMVFSLLDIWGVQLPLAFLLPRVTNLGVYGVRWAIVIGTVVGAIAYITYYWLGRWKRKRV